MSYRLQYGDWSVDVDEDLERQIKASLTDMDRLIVNRIHHDTLKLFKEAKMAWPVGPYRGRAHSRDRLRHVMTVRPDEIEGQVISPAHHTRYIKSAQIIAGSGLATSRQYLRSLYSRAKTKKERDDIEKVKTRSRDYSRRASVAQLILRRTNKKGRKAARQGSASWVLLRWPEAYFAHRLEQDMGPEIERAMAAHLEG